MFCVWCRGNKVAYRIRMKKQFGEDYFACAVCAPFRFSSGWLPFTKSVEELSTGRVLWDDGSALDDCKGDLSSRCRAGKRSGLEEQRNPSATRE